MGRRLAGAIGQLALVWAALVTALIAIANIELTAPTNVISARIGGGEPAATTGRRRVGGPHGTATAWLSLLANLPARAGFAYAHATRLDAYDRLVGTYQLGETYPGLNEVADKLDGRITYGDIGSPRFAGLSKIDTTHAHLTGERARVIVGLNRRGRVAITFHASAPVTVQWNGEPLVVETTGDQQRVVDDLRHGSNELVLQPTTPGDVTLSELTLHALP